MDNVEWRQLYAEDLPAGLGQFRVVTFAQSFHWMDQHRVARAVHGMLTPDGAAVHVHATTHRGIETDAELPLPSPPYAELEELSRRYVAPPPPRTGGPGRSGESDAYRAAGFRGPTSITVAAAGGHPDGGGGHRRPPVPVQLDPAPVRGPAGRRS